MRMRIHHKIKNFFQSNQQPVNYDKNFNGFTNSPESRGLGAQKNNEEKAKVVAAVWGTVLIQFYSMLH